MPILVFFLVAYPILQQRYFDEIQLKNFHDLLKVSINFDLYDGFIPLSQLKVHWAVCYSVSITF